MRYITILTLVLGLSACTSEEKSQQALEKAGYTNIELGGYDWLGCSEDDVFKTNFTAQNPQGNVISGTVCCGWFKGCTIRF